jgi:hypothetical protein
MLKNLQITMPQQNPQKKKMINIFKIMMMILMISLLIRKVKMKKEQILI